MRCALLILIRCIVLEILTWLKMGDRDTSDINIERLPDNIMGASADCVNCADLDDTQKYHVGKVIGKPTNVLPDGSRIQIHQKEGKRHYSGKLHKAGTNVNAACNSGSISPTSWYP